MNGGPTREALADMIARGASDAEAGRRFGLSRSAVRRLRRRWGIATGRTSCRPPDPLRDDGGFRWGRGNLSEREIARRYGGRRYDAAGACSGLTTGEPGSRGGR
jgi:DNA-binding CsgD family transcriptional regulator